MPEPFYGTTTETLYARLPDAYREDDALNDWTLKTWLSGIVDQVSDIEDLINRLDFDTPEDGGAPDETSDLANPLLADAAWLPWLGQVLGFKFKSTLTVDQQRAILSAPGNGYKSGTKDALVTAASVNLTGEKRVTIYPRTTDVSAVGAGGAWDILIVTVDSETPGGVDVIQDVINAGAKPAGVKLWHKTYSTDWATIEAAYPTWADWEAAGSWRNIEETGL